MSKLLRNNGVSLPATIELVAGNSLKIKVVGLGSNKRHIILKSSNPSWLSVKANTPDQNRAEQIITLLADEKYEGDTGRQVDILAYLDDGKGSTRDNSTNKLNIKILPKLALPAVDTEAGILARMFIAESPGPEHRKFVTQEDAQETMQWMRHVLINRLEFGAYNFTKNPAASKKNNSITTITAAIKEGGQVQGFSSYPSINTEQNTLILKVIKFANDGTDSRNSSYRQFVQAAIDVANGKDIAADPCPTGLYSWVTAGSAGPGSNFVFFKSKGGQDFYTLTPEFKADPLLRPKK
ncbi:hypothetical protein HZU77_007630 [Neisseriaceae bacterium TC5R-5]|nr:hypothetical protein [Neisseriaceae bacterium TC5R-5]